MQPYARRRAPAFLLGRQRGSERVKTPVVLRGLPIARGPQTVERGLEDGREVAGVALDHGDGDDHVEDLLEGEVVADFVHLLCGDEERPAGGEHAGAAFADDRLAAV